MVGDPASDPATQLLDVRREPLEPLLHEDEGSPVVSVSDATTQRLVEGPEGLDLVPLVPRQELPAPVSLVSVVVLLLQADDHVLDVHEWDPNLRIGGRSTTGVQG